jgi:hypothetical protein
MLAEAGEAITALPASSAPLMANARSGRERREFISLLRGVA